MPRRRKKDEEIIPESWRDTKLTLGKWRDSVEPHRAWKHAPWAAVQRQVSGEPNGFGPGQWTLLFQVPPEYVPLLGGDHIHLQGEGGNPEVSSERALVLLEALAGGEEVVLDHVPRVVRECACLSPQTLGLWCFYLDATPGPRLRSALFRVGEDFSATYTRLLRRYGTVLTHESAHAVASYLAMWCDDG